MVSESVPPVLDPAAASNAPQTSSRSPRRWSFWSHAWIRTLIVFSIGSILLVWAFRSEIAAAVDVWNSSRTFGHAFFIFPVTLFLFYRLRHQLAALQPKPWPWALALVALAMLIWMIGDLANVTVVKQIAFVVVWQSVFLLVFGWQVAMTSLFPLAYLYLAVPFGLSMIPALQDVTAQIVVYLLRFSGVPVFLEGYHIEIPTASFLVAEACSGVRYLMVCIALGLLAAYLFFRSWPRRILFIALSILVPIVANGLRAYGIVMVAHLGHLEFAFDLDHVVYGFVFLSVVTLALLGLGLLLRDSHHAPTASPAIPIAANQGLASSRSVAAKHVGYPALAVAIAVAVQAWAGAAKAPPPAEAVTLHAPDFGSWTAAGGAPTWSSAFHGTDAELQQGYRRGGERIDLQIGYYAYQREGAEAVSDLNVVTGRSDAKVLRARDWSIQIADESLPIKELVVLSKGRPRLVWYWYQIGDSSTSSRLVGKMLEIKALVTGGERSAAIVAVSAEVSENVGETAILLNAFLQESLAKYGSLYRVDKSLVAAPKSLPNPTGGVVNP